MALEYELLDEQTQLANIEAALGRMEARHQTLDLRLMETSEDVTTERDMATLEEQIIELRKKRDGLKKSVEDKRNKAKS